MDEDRNDKPLTATVGRFTLTVFGAESAAPRPVLYLHQAARDAAAVRRAAPFDYALVCIDGTDWEADFSPWPAPRAFKTGDDFSGGAPAYLRTLTGEILPAAERMLSFEPEKRGLIGYSMAGLFAAYALYETDAFQWFASVSGSLWFDGFLDYALKGAKRPAPGKLYLSLGDREAVTKNARLAAVARCTEQFYVHIRDSCGACRYEMNKGGHFDDPAGRIARAVAWLTEGKTI